MAIIVLIIISIVLCFSLSSCDKKNNGSGGGGHGTPASPVYYYICEYSSTQDMYDVNDVTLNFTIGLTNKDGIDRFYMIYLFDNSYNNYTEEERNAMYENKSFPLVPIYLFFYSFGNKYLIKSIDDFLTEDYIGGQQMEITIPSELFYNEYGLIEFGFTESENGDKYTKIYKQDAQCRFYYKKDNDNIYISDNDLMPEGYLRTNTFPDIEGNTDHGFRNDNRDLQDICAFYGHITKDFNQEPYDVYLYFGHLDSQGERDISSVDICIVNNQDGQDNKIYIKTVDNYMSDEYLCTRLFDYYGKTRTILFNHSELIQIQSDYFMGDSGAIKICIYETATQNLLSSIDIEYELIEYVKEDYHWKHYNIGWHAHLLMR